MKYPLPQFRKWLKQKFTNAKQKTDSILFKNAKESILVVQDLKRFFEMPFFDMTVEVTPNKVDNALLPVIRRTLDEAIMAMKEAKGCAHLPTQDERLKCFISAMREAHKADLNALYLKIAAWYFIKREEQRFEYKGISTAKEEVQAVYNDLKSEGVV